ncbi:unknown [Acidiphilium sp. CAG:727]|nr:unknown [Acidiphilium sp. CAG:727]
MKSERKETTGAKVVRTVISAVIALALAIFVFVVIKA